MAPLNLSVGTFGFDGAEKLQTALDALKSLGITEIDTAEIYGNNEADLGEAGAVKQGFAVSTKNPGGARAGSLADIKNATAASLDRLKTDQVDILYVHTPDESLKPADYAHHIDELHRAGKFRRFGISNYSVDETRELHQYCASKGLVLPTVYQGNYNAVSRFYDDTLLPVLRELGIVFYAYSPIAGGFLTKTRKAIEDNTAEGRFKDDKDNRVAQLYRGMYIKPKMLEGLGRWEELAKQQGVPQAELAYRWVYYHSKLSPAKGDFLILGAGKVEQLLQTHKGLQNGPLAPEVVKGIDEVWDIVKADAFENNFEAYKKSN